MSNWPVVVMGRVGVGGWLKDSRDSKTKSRR
jgi:hypothetical protein